MLDFFFLSSDLDLSFKETDCQSCPEIYAIIQALERLGLRVGDRFASGRDDAWELRRVVDDDDDDDEDDGMEEDVDGGGSIKVEWGVGQGQTEGPSSSSSPLNGIQSAGRGKVKRVRKKDLRWIFERDVWPPSDGVVP